MDRCGITEGLSFGMWEVQKVAYRDRKQTNKQGAAHVL